jgi:biopolymer transport protein ExbD
MSASLSSEIRAEPNLTPLLDVVFQLITFFMLVINFGTDNYDQRVRLPVAGSARPIEDADRIATDRIVLNVNRQGHLLFNGEVQLPHKAIETIKREAQLVLLNARAAGVKVDRTALPTTIVLRADRDTPFAALYGLITACQSSGFNKFALKAMSGS